MRLVCLSVYSPSFFPFSMRSVSHQSKWASKAYFQYFEEIKGDLCYHLTVCVLGILELGEIPPTHSCSSQNNLYYHLFYSYM
jgi:hypothetical protein